MKIFKINMHEKNLYCCCAKISTQEKFFFLHCVKINMCEN